jgi:hypothetical protein
LTVETHIKLKCDKCGRYAFDAAFHQDMDARAVRNCMMQQHGWQRWDNLDVCQRCARRTVETCACLAMDGKHYDNMHPSMVQKQCAKCAALNTSVEDMK